jgi:hypothetical protein
LPRSQREGAKTASKADFNLQRHDGLKRPQKRERRVVAGRISRSAAIDPELEDGWAPLPSQENRRLFFSRFSTGKTDAGWRRLKRLSG